MGENFKKSGKLQNYLIIYIIFSAILLYGVEIIAWILLTVLMIGIYTVHTRVEKLGKEVEKILEEDGFLEETTIREKSYLTDDQYEILKMISNFENGILQAELCKSFEKGKFDKNQIYKIIIDLEDYCEIEKIKEGRSYRLKVVN